MRWHHPERGVLPPDSFIPLAEETGLIHELGRQVLIEACTQTRRWQVEHPSVPVLSVSVNLSPGQLAHDDVKTMSPTPLASLGSLRPALSSRSAREP